MDIPACRPGDARRLEQLVQQELQAKPRDRYRAVLLALRGFTAERSADQLGRSRRFVQRWAYRYRDAGLEALREQPRPGPPPKLPRAAEAVLKDRLAAGPRETDGVCTLRGRDIQRILRQEFGVPYTLQGVYDLLHRLGYSYLQPRPRHRKNDPAAMEQWLHDAPLLSRRSGERSGGGGWKCGSRMKAAAASKAR